LRSWWRTPEAALFALVFGAYAYFYQAGGWNQNSRFDLTRALIEDHSLAIDRLARNTGDNAARLDHVFSDKAPGVSLAGAIPYAIVNAIAGSPRPGPRYLAWSSWLSTVFAVSCPSALGVVALAYLLAALGLRAGPRLGLAAAWGLATLAFPYATLYYGHQLIASLLIASFALLVRIRRGVDLPSRARLIAVGALGGWAIVVEYPAAMAAIVIGAYAVVTVRPRHLVWILVGGLGPALVLAWYHTAAFGGPLHLPYDFSTQGNRRQGFFMGIGAPAPGALLSILITPFRGLFYSAPWLLLAAPGGVLLWRRGGRAETIVCAAIAVLFVWMNASLVDWDGGWAMGPRYIIPCIPFLVVLVAGCLMPPVVRASRAARVAIALLVGYSAFLMFAGAAVQPEVDCAIKAPIADFILPHLARGDVAASDQSIDMISRARDGSRYAWNLGQQLGLGGLVSLAPLVAWSGALTWLLVRRARASGC
jgi:hypothetical protein